MTNLRAFALVCWLLWIGLLVATVSGAMSGPLAGAALPLAGDVVLSFTAYVMGAKLDVAGLLVADPVRHATKPSGLGPGVTQGMVIR